MKKLLAIGAMVVGMGVAANADVILSWTFAGTAAIVSQVANSIDANLDTGGSYNDLTRGAGATATAAGSSFRTTGFRNDGISTANTDYYQFIVSAASGYSLSLSGISGLFNGTTTYSASPGVSQQWAYSFDGSSFTLIDNPVPQIGNGSSSFDFSGTAALQNISDATDVTLRYYASGQTSTGGWGPTGAGASLTVEGSLTLIPEPSVFALLSIGGLALARFARRRSA